MAFRLLLLLLLLSACTSPPGHRNRLPTVTILTGPDQLDPGETALFRWQGYDADGLVTGYRYGIDETIPSTWTESSSIRLSGIPSGNHVFYLVAVDDSGGYSLPAAHPFLVRGIAGIPCLGTDTTFELATWNLREFPLAAAPTIKLVAGMMLTLDLDIYALQEISDTVAFRRLLNRLPGYRGLYSYDDYGSSYQKTGIVYRQTAISVQNVHQVFWENDSFPRPPLVMQMAASEPAFSFSSQLIVLHLKAGQSSSDRARRAGACRALKAYFDSLLVIGDSNIIAAGDWNDELSDPPDQNVFLPLLSDSSRYRFLTLPLTRNPQQASYIPSSALLDHIMTTARFCPGRVRDSTFTLRTDDVIPGYLEFVSDHRPVITIIRPSR
ncbi:MAG: endonuclease/exonuclease/phosphatase family protein [candidate division WOR-3 bacterium]